MGLENPTHLAIIVVVLLLVFGAKRLPEIGRSLGEGMRGFKDSVSGGGSREAQTLAPPAPPPPPAPPVQQAPPAVADPPAVPVAAPPAPSPQPVPVPVAAGEPPLVPAPAPPPAPAPSGEAR